LAGAADAPTRAAANTHTGAAALRRATPHWERAQKDVAARLGREKLDTLIDVLAELESLHPAMRPSPQPSPRAAARGRTSERPSSRAARRGSAKKRS
jgi:hypothetical protein